MRKASEHLRAFEAMGVDLVLGGHVHRMHLTRSRDVVPGPAGDPGIPLVACGTSASRRGRGPESGRNSAALLRVGESEIEVTPHFLEPGSERFAASEPTVMARRPSRVVPVSGGGA